jgi:spermidine synthase
MKNYRLELIVFLCGASVMIFELVGTRVLAPYLGTSTYVWTSLIGVILGSLSIGYWIGGRVADRKVEWEIFAGLIFLAAAIIGISTYMKDILLDIIVMKVTDIRWGSALASVLLFAPASILLGMVSPYAIKQKSRKFEEIGTTVGDLYAFSTVGSIIGTFLAGFYLIPRFGTNKILVMISLTLTATAIIALPKRMIAEKALMMCISLAFIAGGGYLAREYDGHAVLADVDTEYSRVRISDETFRKTFINDDGRAVRVMRMGNTINSGIYQSNDDLFLPYTRYFRLARHFRPDVKHSLMIGGGAFVYPMDFLRQFPRATMDVAEIDPRLTELARKYFRLRDDRRLRIINEDGRIFLNRTQDRYDVIFCDAFSSYYAIPYQLTTRESIKQLYRVLNNGGVALVNIISAIEGDNGRFLRAEYATFRSEFSQVYLFPVHSADDGKLFQNIMLVAIKGDKEPRMTSEDPELESYLSHLWRKDVPLDLPTLTDNYAPVDHYIGLHL